MRRNKLIRIGVTGGMGAGKTTVAGFFEEAGLLVVEADMVARDVLELYPEIQDYIRQTYGEEYFLPGGALDRRRFAHLVFSDPARLSAYEGVIMPFILEEIRERFDFIEDVTEDDFAVLDAPLLFHELAKDLYDVSLTVEMPKELQIERVMARDGISREEVEVRLARQMTREEREARADFILINDGSLEQLKEKALDVLEQIRQRGWHDR